MLTFKNMITILVLLIFIMGVLTSCRFAEIVDLVHKDSEKFYGKYDLSEPTLSQYQTNEVLLLPYMTHNPSQTYNDEFRTYALDLVAYKQKENNSMVTVNRVTVEGAENVQFNKITVDIGKHLKFKNYEKHEDMDFSAIEIIDEVNYYNMNLTDRSKIKVKLNITVRRDDKMITEDLEYIFETKTRKYLVQR